MSSFGSIRDFSSHICPSLVEPIISMRNRVHEAIANDQVVFAAFLRAMPTCADMRRPSWEWPWCAAGCGWVSSDQAGCRGGSPGLLDSDASA
jgi:hypothetical protein